MDDSYKIKVEITGDAEKKLNADIETATKRSKQKVEELTGAFKTSSEKIIAYGKLVNDKERADQRIRVAETKSQLDIKYANLKAALDKEVIAVQGAKEMEVKAAINNRKLMESELRQFEATHRNILSKELADFKATKQAELSEQRKYASMLNNAPRTTLRGSIGSEGYTSQLIASQRKMLPGSEEFTQTGLLIDRYKSKLKEAGIETEALANKTSLFRQKQINLGADLTVLAFGVRGIIGDFKNLSAELSTGEAGFGKIAESVGLASLQILTMVPAISALTKAFAASTGALKVFTVAAGTLVGGIAAVGTAIGLLIGNIMSLGKNLSMIGSVLSGQISVWDAVKQSIKNTTFGLIDFTNETDNAIRSMEQLLSLSTVSGKQFDNMIDSQNYENKFKEGGEFHGKYTKEEQQQLITNYKALQNVQTEFEQGEERITQHRRNQADILYSESQKKEKSSRTAKEEREVELNFLQQLRENVKKLQGEEAALNLMLKESNLLDYEKLAINEKILEVQKQLAELMKQQRTAEGRSAFTNLRVAADEIKQFAKKTLSFSTDGEQGGGGEEQKYSLGEIVGLGINFARELTNVLQIGADTFIGKLLSGLQSAISLANSLVSFIGGILNTGSNLFSGGIFGLIGGLFSAPGGGGMASMSYGGSGSTTRPVIINMNGNLSQLGQYQISSNGGQVALRYGGREL